MLPGRMARIFALRAWLERNVFRDRPPPPSLGAPGWLLALSVAAALMLAQLARLSSSRPLNSIWAEDGTTYLPDARHLGFIHALFLPHNDYLQILPRLIVEPLAWLPLRWYAAAVALAGAGVVAALCLVVWHASAAYLRDPVVRALQVGLVVLTPVAGVEMFDNAVNTIWFLLFVGFWLLLWRPATVRGAVVSTSLMLLATLSTAGMVFMLPLWVLRAVVVRDRRDGLLVGSYAIGLAIQLGVLSGQKPITPSHWGWTLVPAYLQRTIGGGLLGDTLTSDLWRALGVPLEIVLALGVVALLVLAVLRAPAPARVLAPLTAAISLAMFLASGYQRDLASALLWPHGTANTIGARYVVVPALLLSAAVLMLLDSAIEPRRSIRKVRMGWSVAAVLLILALSSFDVSNPARGTATWSGALQVARTACIAHPHKLEPVQINPVPMFKAPLTCRELEGD